MLGCWARLIIWGRRSAQFILVHKVAIREPLPASFLIGTQVLTRAKLVFGLEENIIPHNVFSVIFQQEPTKEWRHFGSPSTIMHGFPSKNSHLSGFGPSSPNGSSRVNPVQPSLNRLAWSSQCFGPLQMAAQARNKICAPRVPERSAAAAAHPPRGCTADQ